MESTFLPQFPTLEDVVKSDPLAMKLLFDPELYRLREDPKPLYIFAATWDMHLRLLQAEEQEATRKEKAKEKRKLQRQLRREKAEREKARIPFFSRVKLTESQQDILK